MASKTESVTWEIVEKDVIEKPAQLVLAEVRDLIVDSPDMYREAADMLQKVKAAGEAVEVRRKKITDPLRTVLARIMDEFRPAAEFYAGAEKMLKDKMGNYAAEQDRLRRKAEAEARERARIEQARLDKEAADARDAAQRMLAAAETAATDTERESALEAAAEAAQEALNLETVAQMPVMPVATVVEQPKATGTSQRWKYTGDVTDKLALLQFVTANPALIHLVDVNQSAINQIAAAQKDGFQMPGVQLNRAPIIASRRAA